MKFEQQTFLGASIRGFNTELGWGDQPSSLTVHLVEDPRNVDELVAPYVGSPVSFRFDNFRFDGILDNITEEYGSNGNRVLTANISDPRRFLDGIQLITNGYAGSRTMTNVYNLFNFYENRGYGQSRVNDMGMLSSMIHQGIQTMIGINPIYFADNRYYLDISSVPIIGDDYRVSQNIISLLDFIQDCCDISNRDYTVYLIDNIIKVQTIDRGFIPSPGAIQSYINSIDGASQKTHGLEYNYNPSSKFLIGGPVDTTYFRPLFIPHRNIETEQREDEDGDSYTFPVAADYWVDNGTICRFWGEDANSNLIFGRRLENFIDPDDEVITVSAYEVGLPYYQMTIGELRAASVSQDVWEDFIILNDFEGSIHQGKSNILKINAEIQDSLQELFTNRPLDKISPHLIANMMTKFRLNDKEREYSSRIYEFIRTYATDFLGVRYAVSIPNVMVKVNEYNYRLKDTNLSPTDSGYLEDGEIINAIVQGIMPEYFTFVQDEYGKITPYVKFSNYEDLDLSALNVGVDYVIDYDFVRSNGETALKKHVYVRCQIDDRIYFGNSFLGEDPRVVITLPDAVYSYSSAYNRTNVLPDAFLKSKGILPRRIDGATNAEISRDTIARKRSVFYSVISSDLMLASYDPIPLYPELAVIPLRNNQMTYGPWVAEGRGGKVDIEQNDDLTPWNFGGVAVMNKVGERMVRDILITDIEGQTGSITVPGTPNIGIGGQIPGGGPYITGITTNVGQDGVTTTYRYGKWSLKTGKMSSYQTERYRKIYQAERDRKRALRDLYSDRAQRMDLFWGKSRRKSKRKPRRERPNSASAIMMGQSIAHDDKIISQVASMPYYNVQQLVAEEFGLKGGISMDGLFRPYEVNGDGENLPVYNLPDEPEEGDEEGDEDDERSTEINSRDLFPFKEGHDVSVVFTGDEPDARSKIDAFSDEQEYNEKIRGMALKGPLVVAGWGYDTDGKPVPNKDEDDPGDEFLEDHLKKYNKWKVGPVDLRWDEDRGVWASGGPTIVEGLLSSSIIAPSSSSSPTSFTIKLRRGEDWEDREEIITCYNRDKSLSILFLEDSEIFVIAARINNEWRPIWIGCEEDE